MHVHNCRGVLFTAVLGIAPFLVSGCGDDDPATVGPWVPTDGGLPTDGQVLPDGNVLPETGDALPDIAPPDGPTVTVQPTEIDDILTNPGMGFANMHGSAPPPPEHPVSTVAYYRWTWTRLEPTEGQYDFDVVDSAIQSAKGRGETLAFRIMTVYDTSSPQWLLDKGVDSVAADDGIFVDHNNPIFLDYQERLVRAFGERYAGSLDVDHVDIGSVGCWGEWNTACCSANKDTCDQYFPTETNQETIIDWYFDYFPNTPLVMLVGGHLEYAVSRGAGWRGDCFGDYGYFSTTWNHMEHSYGPAAEDPIVGEAWRTAPVQFEVCGVMQDWVDLGFDIDQILQKGLEWHMSVLNAKSRAVPPQWRAQVDEFTKRMGYRMVLREMTHTSEADAGDSLLFQSQWENVGVARMYHPWPLAYRLRSNTDEVVAQWASASDTRTWLPGAHSVQDVVLLGGDVAAGTYSLDMAILMEDSSAAHVELAIEGKGADGWYPVSEVVVGG